jgi:uncharacterized YigZ family protein
LILSEIIDSYKTLQSKSEGLYKEKGSKFIGLAFPVKNETEIKDKLLDIRREYHDARHHCYAWALGVGRSHYRANDDGEPSSSAGKPIFGRLESFDLTQMLIVVVRYFGGTKLGVGGLINAYRSAAEDAINNGQIINRKMKVYFDIHFKYAQMNEVMQLVKNTNVDQLTHEFELDCRMKLASPQGAFAALKILLLKIDDLKINELYIA